MNLHSRVARAQAATGLGGRLRLSSRPRRAGVCGVGGTGAALEWLARRRDGESVALIAARDGVGARTVKRATDPYGPFPVASQHRGRSVADAAAVRERTARWVLARQRGQRVADIAAREGVAHQRVSWYTKGAGPFPSPAVVDQWVAARVAGRTLAAIAQEFGAASVVVSGATRAFGPFRPPGPRLPDGLVGPGGIAALAGVSGPTALRGVRTGRVPAPDFVVGDGRKLWLDGTITRWLDSADLATCPTCGARCVRLAAHRAAAHR